MCSERFDYLRKGLSDLKMGAMLSLIFSIILLFASFILLLALLGTFVITSPVLSSLPWGFLSLLSSLGAIVSILLMLSLPLLAIALIFLVASYKFFKATGYLKEFDKPRLWMGRLGTSMQMAGLLMIAVGSLIGPASLAASIPSLLNTTRTSGSIFSALLLLSLSGWVLGALMFGVGRIPFIIAVMRLEEIEGLDKGFKTAGIPYLIGTLLFLLFPFGPILTLLLDAMSFILIHNCSANSLRSLV